MVSAAVPARRARALGAAIAVLAGPVLFASEISARPPTPATPAVSAEVVPTATAQANFTAALNRYRQANGRRPVTANPTMQNVARGHAAYMARVNRLTHTGANGSNAGQRLTAAGVRWSAWGENIAVGYSNSGAVLNAWRNSAGHRAVMLNPSFTHLGLAVVYGNGRYWWCLVMADL